MGCRTNDRGAANTRRSRHGRACRRWLSAGRSVGSSRWGGQLDHLSSRQGEWRGSRSVLWRIDQLDQRDGSILIENDTHHPAAVVAVPQFGAILVLFQPALDDPALVGDAAKKLTDLG